MNLERKRKVARFIVKFSASSVVTTIVVQNVEPKRWYNKVILTVGTYVLSDMVGQLTYPWTDKILDDLMKTVEEVKTNDDHE